jgi:hypothetical protein
MNELECLSLASLSSLLEAYRRVEHLMGASLGWKGLSGTNTLAYYENPLITAVKSFIVQASGVHHLSIVDI